MRCSIAALAVIVSTAASASPPTLTGQAAQRYIASFERIVAILPRENKDLMNLAQWQKIYPASECAARTEPNPSQSDSTRVFINCPEFADTSQLSFVFVTDPTRDKKALYLKEVLNNGDTLKSGDFETFVNSPERQYGNFQTILSRQDVLLAVALGNDTFAKFGDLQMFQGRMVEDMGYYCDVAAQKVHEPRLVLRCQEEIDESKPWLRTKPAFFVNIIMDSNQLWMITDIRIGNRRIVGRDLFQFLKPLRPRQQSNR